MKLTCEELLEEKSLYDDLIENRFSMSFYDSPLLYGVYLGNYLWCVTDSPKRAKYFLRQLKKYAHLLEKAHDHYPKPRYKTSIKRLVAEQ